MPSDDAFQNLNIDILRICGSLALDMNALPLAFKVFKKTLSLAPYDLPSILLLCNAHLMNKSYLDIIHLLLDAITTKKNSIASDVRIWKQLAFAYYQLNRYEDADHAISQAMILLNNNKIDVEKNNNIIKSELDDAIIHKIYVLHCRITLLAPIKTNPIDMFLHKFQDILNNWETTDKSYYAEILITRAQLFRKYKLFDECRDDLYTVIQVLNEERNGFSRKDLLNKVFYSYNLLAFVEFNINNEFNKYFDVIKEANQNFDLPSLYYQKLLILETQFHYLKNSTQLVDCLNKLQSELQLTTSKLQPYILYMMGRLSIIINPQKNIEKAFGYYQDAVSLAPQDPAIWISIASLYFELGQLDDALSTYSKAVSISFSKETNRDLNLLELKIYNILAAVAWFGISQVYTASGQLDSAAVSIGEAIRLFKMENETIYVEKLTEIQTNLRINNTKYKRLKDSKSISSEPIKISDKFFNFKAQDFKDSNNIPNTNPKAWDKVEYTVHDIPMEILIDLQACKDQNIFRAEYELDHVVLKTSHIDSGSQLTNSRRLSSIITPPISQKVINLKAVEEPTNSNSITHPQYYQQQYVGSHFNTYPMNRPNIPQFNPQRPHHITNHLPMVLPTNIQQNNQRLHQYDAIRQPQVHSYTHDQYSNIGSNYYGNDINGISTFNQPLQNSNPNSNMELSYQHPNYPQPFHGNNRYR